MWSQIRQGQSCLVLVSHLESIDCGGRTLLAPASFRGTDLPQPRSTVNGDAIVTLSEIDRNLLERCIARKPRAWEDFVDRFMGLVLHVISHTARARSIRIRGQDTEDLCGQVFLEIVKNDFALLRHFRRQSSLATYLTVVTRRVVEKELMQRKSLASLGDADAQQADKDAPGPEQRLTDRDEVQRLLSELSGQEAEIIRLYHLEGKSYQEISSSAGVAENSVGPVLSRAREKMRRASADSTTS